MSIVFEERESDSPYIEAVTHGRTISSGAPTRPAENHWHMVVTKVQGSTRLFVVGPWSKSGIVTYGEGADVLWIKFKLGTFMPHMPMKQIRDSETALPNAASQSFWLKSSAWQFPDHNNVETFASRLAREGILMRDPLVYAALDNHAPDISPRTVRNRFLQATGLTQSHIRQMKRAQQAAALLRRGISILDAVHEAGYYDQPHLTRSLKQFIGFTPAQIIQMSQTG